ncbi:hypothetical protein BJX61DRAFT_539178 [Aspergillus egyptiacus]|nr:hypothetical protein BJX61DRAFT_539178 [Aspergillus egyptiacus]
MFYPLDPSGENEKAAYACHACFDEGRLSHQYVKCYKHCVLADAITPELAKTICGCRSVAGVGENGRRRRFFPMSKDDERAHRPAVRPGAVQCPLLSLGDMVAEAKYAGLVSNPGRRIILREEERTAKEKLEKKRTKREEELSYATGSVQWLVDPRSTLRGALISSRENPILQS